MLTKPLAQCNEFLENDKKNFIVKQLRGILQIPVRDDKKNDD